MSSRQNSVRNRFWIRVTDCPWSGTVKDWDSREAGILEQGKMESEDRATSQDPHGPP